MARVSCSVPKLSLWQRCLRAINRISDISPQKRKTSPRCCQLEGTGEGMVGSARERQNAQRQDIPLVYFSDASV